MALDARLGIAPIAWSNDDLPELGGDTSLETCRSEARLAGFSGVGSGGKFPTNAAELGPILDAHHLRLMSGWYFGTVLDADPEAEQDPAKAPPLEYARIGHAALTRALTAAGYKIREGRS